MLFLVLAAQALGIFFISLIPVLRMGMSLGSLLGMLSFSISGMSIPVSSMIAPMQTLAYIFPLRYYFRIGINQALIGAPSPTRSLNISGYSPSYSCRSSCCLV